jgi:hypothetical protein
VLPACASYRDRAEHADNPGSVSTLVSADAAVAIAERDKRAPGPVAETPDLDDPRLPVRTLPGARFPRGEAVTKDQSQSRPGDDASTGRNGHPDGEQPGYARSPPPAGIQS